MFFSPDGRWIAAGGLDGAVILWDAHTGEAQRTLFMDPERGFALMGLSNRVTWVTFDAQSERVAAGCFDGEVRIWRVATGELLTRLIAEEYGSAPSTMTVIWTSLSPTDELTVRRHRPLKSHSFTATTGAPMGGCSYG